VRNILIYIFLIVWATCIVYIGIPNIYKVLGGSTGFYFILPFVVCIILKYKALAKLLWSIVLTLVGLMVVNYLYSHFFCSYRDFQLLTKVYLIYAPIGCIWLGYACTLQYFLVKQEDLKRKEDIDALRYFAGFYVAALTVPLSIIVPILDLLKGLTNINSIGYQIGLSSLILGSLMFLYEVRKIPIETLNYFARPSYRFDANIDKFEKTLVIGTLVFLVFSTYWEIFYRRQWIMWAETVIVFIIYLFVLYNFGKILFMPRVSDTQRPTRIYLPSIKSRKNIIMVLIFLGLFFFITLAGEFIHVSGYTT
jgi:hypothetical protein